MHGKKKKIALGLLLLCFVIMGPLLAGGKYVDAAAKPSLNMKSITIPIGKQNKDTYWFDSDGNFIKATALAVNNKIKGATYEFSSGNKKIATISKKGGYITGLKKGTTTITCKQTYKNKTTVVGTCKVTVKEASLVSMYPMDVTLERILVNFDYFDGIEGYSWLLPYDIYYRNQDATYTIESSSEDLVFREASLTEQQKKFHTPITEDPIYECIAYKPGTYTLNVIETYNKKSRTVGKFTVIAHDVEISKEAVQVRVGSNVSVWEPLRYYIPGRHYSFVYSDYDAFNADNNKIKLGRSEYDQLLIYGLKPGKATIKVYEDSAETGRYLGEYTVEVLPNPDLEQKKEDSGNTYYPIDDFYN